MKTKLWQVTGAKLDPMIEDYTVGEDNVLDQRLLGYDIRASKAHVAMLGSIGILDKSGSKKLIAALDQLHKEWKAGMFQVRPEHEDGHTAIELYLTEKLGDLGKKVHTARSRNDQALVMMRLYLKDSLDRIDGSLATLVDAYGISAKRAGDIAMPGYTHGQKAMPTTVAAWLGSFAAGFDDLHTMLNAALRLVDQNPLGSAAGFGVDLPVDRDMTAKELGFGKVQDNPMYCGLSRGLFELVAVQALSPVMVLAGKFARDMLMFTGQEYGFFSLPAELTTGSSIMPHKRNYDLFEIMRGHADAFGGHMIRLQAIAGGAGSGYNRDLQLTKGVVLQAFDTAKATLDVLTLAVPRIKPDKDALSKAMTDELFTVARINELVGQGVPFRDAYMRVKGML
ncbi:MAG TPA: argininosuccinate lyase [Candidatus Saccharimonadales bacterium]|nr:argininosuccinate lyase [Candidatus Saccharimonadales bacterium]